MRAVPNLTRLRLRLRNYATDARYLRDIVAAPDVPIHAGYVRAGAQRDHAKLRVNSRAAHLAYAFLRLRPYRMVEPKAGSEPHWGRVQRLVEQYSDEPSGTVLQRFAEWRESEDVELSERARETLQARWQARRDQRADVRSLVDRAQAISHEGG